MEDSAGGEGVGDEARGDGVGVEGSEVEGFGGLVVEWD